MCVCVYSVVSPSGRLSGQAIKQTPSDFFDLYFSEEFLNILIEEINHNADQFHEKNRNRIDRGEMRFSWTPVVMDEIGTLLGLLSLMAINFLPEINKYWTKDELYLSPIYGECMTRDRFKVLFRFWHFNSDNYDTQDPDRHT